jgi:PQQ-like domain
MNRRLLTLALATFCLTACGTAGAAAPAAAPAAHPRTATGARPGHAATASQPRPSVTATQPACPARRAYAEEVSPSGRVTWQVKLPTNPTQSGIAVRPLVVGGEAVFGLILVQSDVFGGANDPTAVTALEPRTGRVAWRFDIGIQPWIQGAGSAGIVMATFNPDRLYLVSQQSGRARWSAATFATALQGSAAQIVTAGSVVQLEGRGVPHLVSRRATNGKVLWSKALAGAPDGANLVLTSGSDVVVTLGPAGGGTPSKPNTVSRLWVFRLAAGKQVGLATLPTLVQAPLATAGVDTVAQLDDGVCGVLLTGTATGVRVTPSC